jgi:hypothetical protein
MGESKVLTKKYGLFTVSCLGTKNYTAGEIRLGARKSLCHKDLFTPPPIVAIAFHNSQSPQKILTPQKKEHENE